MKLHNGYKHIKLKYVSKHLKLDYINSMYYDYKHMNMEDMLCCVDS